jgi:diguanylate cyclase (GGDEF)-like protein
MAYRVLIYEPDDDTARFFARALASDACEPVRVHDADELTRLVREDREPRIAVAVVEPLANGSHGLAVLQALEELPRRPPVVVTTAFPSLVERLPALDFVLPKPIGGDTLKVFVDGLARKRALPAPPPLQDAEELARKTRRRVKEIMEVRLLDGHLNQRLQEMAELAARLFETPMAWVTLLLPDAVVAKAVVGTSHQIDGRYPIESYCCRHTVQGETVLELPDVAQVPVLADYFKVKKGVDFCYLGAPIVTATGTVVGTLCVGDYRPRQFGADDAELIDLYARRLGDEIERRNEKETAERRLAELNRELMFDRHGAWSRLAYIERAELGLKRARKRGQEGAELRVIVDHLGDVYEQAGVEAGEEKMGAIVRAVQSAAGADAIVGRMSDEQLAVFVTPASEADALALGQRVRLAVAEARLEAPGAGARLSTSIGVAAGAATHAALARRAELAAAEARRRGRDRVEAYRTHDSATAAAPERRAPLERGWVLDGKYFVEGELAAGGMGVVYRALDLHLERRVALKVLRPLLASESPEYLGMFRREATQMAQVKHANLAQVYAFALDAGVAFIVMELIEGASVADELRAAPGRRLPPARVARIVGELGEALDAVHAAGLLHRDVKPGNVLIERARERAVLVDFGVSGRLREATGGGGTRTYMSPEGLAYEPEGTTSDVWALAATAYKMLTGELAFASGERDELRARQRLGAPPASRRRRRLGPEVDRVLAAGMAFDPAERIASAGAFARELAEAIAHIDQEETTPPSLLASGGRGDPFRPTTRPGVSVSAAVGEPRVRGDLLLAIAAIARERYAASVAAVEGASWLPVAELRAALKTLAAAAVQLGDDPGQVARAAGRRALLVALGQGHAIAPVTRGPGALQGGLAQAWRRLSELGSLALTQTSDRSVRLVLEQASEAPDALVDVAAGFVDRFAEEAGLRHASCEVESRALPPTLTLRWL